MISVSSTNGQKCDYCSLPAQYDFKTSLGPWAYGCTNHWMQHRASRTIGIGHCQHIGKDKPLPKRPADAVGYVAPVSTPGAPTAGTTLAKPTVPRAATPKAARAPAEPKVAKVKPPKVFEDMEPATEQQIPRPGSVLAITIDLCRANAEGATMEEIQAAIGPKHDALKLMQWGAANRGWGWKMVNNRIKVLP